MTPKQIRLPLAVGIKMTMFLGILGFLGLFSSPGMAYFPAPPQGGGSIIVDQAVLRAVSIYPEDPVVRIEVWEGASLVLTETPCGSQTCTTSLSGLSAGTYLAKGFTQSNAQFSETFELD